MMAMIEYIGSFHQKLQHQQNLQELDRNCHASCHAGFRVTFDSVFKYKTRNFKHELISIRGYFLFIY